jgi:hypothetical protein
MSTPTIAKAGNDPASNDEVTTPATHVSNNVTTIHSESALVENKAPSGAPKYFQSMPQNDLSDFLDRMTELQSITFTNSDLAMSHIMSFNPWTLYLQNARIADKAKTYSYMRGTICLYFMFQAPGNAYGSYVFSAICNPPGNQAVVNGTLNNHVEVANCLQVDHYVRVDLSSSENASLQLPFVWPYDYAEYNPTSSKYGPNVWTICITCLSPVQTSIPGGVTTATCKVFAHLMDYEMVVPKLEGKQSRKGALKPHKNLSLHKIAATVGSSAREATGIKEGAVSKVADKVEAVADKLSGVPLIGPYAQTAAKAAHAVGKIGHFFGFSRDSEPMDPMPVTFRSVSNVAQFEGPDRSEWAALTKGPEISYDPTLVDGTDVDVMSNTSLFNRWTYVTSFTWPQASTSGTFLGNVPVMPSYMYKNTTTNRYHPSPAAYVGYPFNYWRGDMEYLIIIPVSKLHRGTLQVIWEPYGSSIAAATSVTNSTLTTIYDVTAGSELHVSVGYARDIPFCINQPSSGSDIVNYSWTNGRVFFRIVNPLLCQDPEASVQVHVFGRACANMEFAGPRNTIRSPLGELLPIHGSITLEGAAGDGEDHHEDVIPLVAASKPYPMDDLLWGERFESVRALMQKPSRLFMDTSKREWFMPQGGPIPFNIPDDKPEQHCFTWAGYYRALFVGWSGSERFKFFPISPEEWTACEPVFPPIGGDVDLSLFPPNTITPMCFDGQNRGYEVAIPYFGSRKFLSYDYMSQDFNNQATRGTAVRYFNRTNAALPVDISTICYYSYGPDIRVNYFRQVPKWERLEAPISDYDWQIWFTAPTPMAFTAESETLESKAVDTVAPSTLAALDFRRATVPKSKLALPSLEKISVPTTRGVESEQTLRAPLLSKGEPSKASNPGKPAVPLRPSRTNERDYQDSDDL